MFCTFQSRKRILPFCACVYVCVWATHPFFSVTSLWWSRRIKQAQVNKLSLPRWHRKSTQRETNGHLLVKHGLDFELVIEFLQFNQEPDWKERQDKTESSSSPTCFLVFEVFTPTVFPPQVESVSQATLESLQEQHACLSFLLFLIMFLTGASLWTGHLSLTPGVSVGGSACRAVSPQPESCTAKHSEWSRVLTYYQFI